MSFVAALRNGETEKAWNYFCPNTQKQLTDLLAKATPSGAKPQPPQKMLFEGGLFKNMREITRVEVLTQSKGRAVLQVVDETEAKQQLTMVLEQEKWCLQLELPQ